MFHVRFLANNVSKAVVLVAASANNNVFPGNLAANVANLVVSSKAAVLAVALANNNVSLANTAVYVTNSVVSTKAVTAVVDKLSVTNLVA